jgi:uncharacterized protein (DUF1501 family)
MATKVATPVTRRNALHTLGSAIGTVGLSKSLFPSWMPRMAFRQAGAPGDVLVVISLRGGMDGLNAVIPFAEGKFYYDRRPTIAIAEPGQSDLSAINLNDFFGLHPALRPMKDIYDAGILAVIHATGSPNPSRSHFDAMEYMERGIPGDKTTASGWISRHLQTAAWQNGSPFRAVGIGAMLPSSLRGPVSAISLRSIADFHLGGREDQLSTIQQTIARMYQISAPTDLLQTQAARVFDTVDILSALSAIEYQPANGAEYPDSDFGMGLRQIAQLIKSDLGLEIAAIDIGGWDTHEEQGGAEGEMAGLLDDLGRGLAAFYADMRDYMHRVTVVTMSEFGRRVVENASRGTDHGHGNAMFIMGGGATGQLYADWRGLAPESLDNGDLEVTTDYRDVLAEILLKRVGNGAFDQIFPGHNVQMRGIIADRV